MSNQRQAAPGESEFRKVWFSMEIPDREKICLKANVSYVYMKTHVVSNPPRKVLRKETMEKLVKASRGRFSKRLLLEHFFGRID